MGKHNIGAGCAPLKRTAADDVHTCSFLFSIFFFFLETIALSLFLKKKTPHPFWLIISPAKICIVLVKTSFSVNCV